jgi:hypothetical protein
VRRRKFIALLGSVVAVRPLGAHAGNPLERILYFTYSAGYRHELSPNFGDGRAGQAAAVMG